jgi:hypothetical protein
MILSSDGAVPSGISSFWEDFPYDDPCSWKDKGLFFAIWMVDSEGVHSDTFYPGDEDWNFSYWEEPEPGLGFGYIVTAFDSFKDKKREKEKEFGITLLFI